MRRTARVSSKPRNAPDQPAPPTASDTDFWNGETRAQPDTQWLRALDAPATAADPAFDLQSPQAPIADLLPDAAAAGTPSVMAVGSQLPAFASPAPEAVAPEPVAPPAPPAPVTPVAPAAPVAAAPFTPPVPEPVAPPRSAFAPVAEFVAPDPAPVPAPEAWVVPDRGPRAGTRVAVRELGGRRRAAARRVRAR